MSMKVSRIVLIFVCLCLFTGDSFAQRAEISSSNETFLHRWFKKLTKELMKAIEWKKEDERTGGAGTEAETPESEEKMARRREELGVKNLEVVDSDLDELSDADEIRMGTDPDRSDTDSDGFYDGDEVELGHNPQDASDHPSLEDLQNVDEYEESDINLSEFEEEVKEHPEVVPNELLGELAGE